MHPCFVIFNCTRCGAEFNRGDSLDVIHDHLAVCSIRVPKYLKTCRWCGLVSIWFFSLYYYIPKSVNTEFKSQKLKMIFLFFTGHNEGNDRGQKEKLQIVGVCLKKIFKTYLNLGLKYLKCLNCI